MAAIWSARSDFILQGFSNDQRAKDIAARIDAFVRDIIIPYERDPRIAVYGHGSPNELVQEMCAKAHAAAVLKPHMLADGSYLKQC